MNQMGILANLDTIFILVGIIVEITRTVLIGSHPRNQPDFGSIFLVIISCAGAQRIMYGLYTNDMLMSVLSTAQFMLGIIACILKTILSE